MRWWRRFFQWLGLISPEVRVGPLRRVPILAEALPPTLTFPPHSGEYLILPASAVDGDTIRFYWLIEGVGRLRGINAPEIHGGNNTKAGLASRDFLEDHLPHVPVRMIVAGREKYGRTLCEVFTASGYSLNSLMVESGHAVTWDGHGDKPE